MTPEREAELRKDVAASAGATWLGEWPQQDLEELLAEIDRLRAENERLTNAASNVKPLYERWRKAQDEVERLTKERDEWQTKAELANKSEVFKALWAENEALREAGELMYVEAPGAWTNWLKVTGQAGVKFSDDGLKPSRGPTEEDPPQTRTNAT